MALSVEQIVKQLADSGIIAPGKLENFIPPKADPKTPEELVQALVKSENLTAFQGQQVKVGKARALILGAYTILDKIGAGGMGQVFKAEHRKMGRLVAIKMLPPAMTKDAAAIARFEREVRAAAKLRHPNIVAADDAAEANGAHFLVMEYVEGKDLSALVKKNGPFAVGKAVNYILQAARGLEFAHGEGVVHRDIKPANLLLDKKEVVKILDMGLARIESDGPAQTELTGTGTIMGTVDYMSPEQALNTKHADHRADIYSLGISLYYLLAGKAAYSGDTAMEKLMAHQTQPIPSLQDTQTTVSKQLDAVFKKMVAKRIEDRYQSMSEVVEALEGLGYGGSSTGRKGDVASTLDLSSADKKKLLAQAKKKPLGSITEVVASEKTKYFFAKIVGGAFGTIIAPLLVFYLIRHLEKQEQPANPPAATVPAATVPPAVVATNTTTQPPAHVLDDGSPKLLVAPFDTKQAHAGQAAWAKHLGTQVETTNSIGMRTTLIPPGEFLMGSTDEQVAAARKMGEDDKKPPADAFFGQFAAEMPQHKVTISHPFLMGSTEVTVAQFRRFVEASKYITEAEKAKEGDKEKNWKNLGYPTTDDTAVTQITWNDACAYCTWLSEQEQRRTWYRADGKGGWQIAASADGYRLPTEAEWEYACRAGTTTQYSFGDGKTQLEQYGWFRNNADRKAQPVALKLSNPFGLFDIHGNAYEWCQDRYDEKWYEKLFSSNTVPTNQSGPSSGTFRVLRGGCSYWYASHCRCAFRSYDNPSYHTFLYGFRIVRPLDPTQPETAVATTAKSSAPPTKPTKPWETPELQAWLKATQALPAEKQIEAVSKKLMELNPGYDGKASNRMEAKQIVQYGFAAEQVSDISPLRTLSSLKELKIHSSRQFADLSPLTGMQISRLSCPYTQVTDLSPLAGLPLTNLNVDSCPLADLSPLVGLPLDELNCFGTKVVDISPLSKIGTLRKLILLKCRRITPAQVAALAKSLPNCEIEWDGAEKPAAGFGASAQPSGSGQQATKPWNTPAFKAWVKEVQAMPADKQVEAVSKKLMELNPGFDGKVTGSEGKGTPKIETGVVTEFGFQADHVADISPLQVLMGLRSLWCYGDSSGKSQLADLSPLEGMPLESLSLINVPVPGLSSLRGMPLRRLYFQNTLVSDLSPLRGMKLTNVVCNGTPVFDLSPLQTMPLTSLSCERTQVSDLSPLQDCKSLGLLLVKQTKVTAASVAALAKSLPNCKIEWDGADKGAVASSQGSAKPWNTLAFQAWVKATQALPAEKQIEAVSKKLMELNPGFNGSVTGINKSPTPKIENGVVTEFGFVTDKVSDISPVRALVGLKVLKCVGSSLDKGKLSDLSPLAGLPLTGLWFGSTQVSDLSPLEGMPLASIAFAPQDITKGLEVIRQMKSLKTIGLRGDRDRFPAEEFWKKYDAGEFGEPNAPSKLAYLDPAFQQWVKATQTLTAEQQIEAVSKKLMELNPGFDGRFIEKEGFPATKDGVVTTFGFVTDNVTDISPVAALSGLRELTCNGGNRGKGKSADLSPLNTLRLARLYCYFNEVSDLTPLIEMPLTVLDIGATKVTDLSPLDGMPLTTLRCGDSKVSNLLPLEKCNRLSLLFVTNSKVTSTSVAALQKALPNCKIEWDGSNPGAPPGAGAKPKTPQPAAAGSK